LCPNCLADATPGWVWNDAGVPAEPEPTKSEADVTGQTPSPRTRASLRADLLALGVQAGDTLLLHSSLSALGWVVGGQVAAVQALLDVVGPAGTLVVPTQTGGNSDPANWSRPPVPPAWWPVIRAEMPAHDPALAPSRGMGVVAEQVRTWPGAARSTHPQNSFAAVGARAAEVTDAQPLAYSLGESSPLAALERLEASVLFLGTGWDTCTALHLAQYRVPSPAPDRFASAVLHADGGQAWLEFDDVDLDSTHFEALGADYERDCPERVRQGLVGSAQCRLFALAGAVAYGVSWLAAHPPEVGP
jgi:aminoglycoside 3-N-acetyltransferase